MRTTITWIPVTQQMPDDDINVLFTNGEHVWTGFHSGGGWFPDLAEPPYDEVILVTQWAHLPEVPK
jgi:hypothetical protein